MHNYITFHITIMASNNLHAYLAGHAPIIAENDANHFYQVRQDQQRYDLGLRRKQADYDRFVRLGGNPFEGFDPSRYSDEAANKEEQERVAALFAAEKDAKNYYDNELKKHQEREKIMELEKNRKEMIRNQQEERQRQHQEERQRQQEEMIRTREAMINENRTLLPPSTMTPMGQLKFWWNKKAGRRSKKKGKKGTRRHSKKKGTRRH